VWWRLRSLASFTLLSFIFISLWQVNKLGTSANHLQPIGAQEGKEFKFKEEVYCSNRGVGVELRMFSEARSSENATNNKSSVPAVLAA
jgi:hypothetical protein